MFQCVVLFWFEYVEVNFGHNLKIWVNFFASSDSSLNPSFCILVHCAHCGVPYVTGAGSTVGFVLFSRHFLSTWISWPLLLVWRSALGNLLIPDTPKRFPTELLRRAYKCVVINRSGDIPTELEEKLRHFPLFKKQIDPPATWQLSECVAFPPPIGQVQNVIIA